MGREPKHAEVYGEGTVKGRMKPSSENLLSDHLFAYTNVHVVVDDRRAFA